MHRGRCALGWLGGAIVLIGACKSDPCENASPTVRLELILAGVAPGDVRSIEILLDRGSDRFRRVYNVDDQLADGRTSLSIEIEPAPDRSFELGVDVRAFDARDGSGEVIASRAVTMQLEPNGCNDGEIELLARTPGKDAGPDDAGPIDAMPMDADPADGGPRDADPIDADPMDADPADAPPDPDAGCSDDDNDGVCNPDDNCPDTPNPSQEDTDGVAAYPIAFAPVVLNNPTPVAFVEPDDAVSNDIPIGFTFEFFGTAFTDVRISTNGFLSFQANPPDGCCTGQNIPDGNAPNNLVALAWNDLWLLDPLSVEYQVEISGTYRRFILQYDNVHICCDPGQNTVTVQAILYENTNEIAIHTTMQPVDNGFTRGIEGPMGLQGAHLPGEANGSFPLADDAVGFTTGAAPDGIGDACSNAF